MTFTMKNTDKKAPITIPGDFLHLAGIEGELRLELQPGVAVLTSAATIQEKVDAMTSLLSIVNALTEEVIEECGGAPAGEECCASCAGCVGHCPDEAEPCCEDCADCKYHGDCDGEILLPPCWLEDAGIPITDSLSAVCKDGRIIITSMEDAAGDGEAEELLTLLELNGIDPDRARELLDEV